MVLAGVAVIVLGGVVWAGAGGHALHGRLVGPNLPVSANAADPLNISANNSPTLARNPVSQANLVVANRVDLPTYSCALHTSSDGGSTWAETAIPFPEGEELPARCYAPDVAYSPDGTLYVAFVTLKGSGNVPNAVWVVSSTDGGRHLSKPVRAGGPLLFQVRVTADPSRTGRLYMTWLHATQVGTLSIATINNPIETVRSDDGGATWSDPITVSSPGRARVLAPSPGVGPRGQLYVAYFDLGDDRLDYEGAYQGQGGDPYQGTWKLIVARSVDHGRTWNESTADPAVQPTQRFIVYLPPTPDLVVDPTNGTVYVAFADRRLGDADVWVRASTDSASSFGPRHRVNDTCLHDGTDQYLPKMAVAVGGRLDIIYYDRRNDPANLANEVSLQTSNDHGRTFTARLTVSDRTFDSRVGPGSERNLADLGSRLALVATAHRDLAVWTDTRAGTDVTGKQDLARAILEMPAPARPSTSTRALSATLIAAGLALIIGAIRLPRRHREPPVSPAPTQNHQPAQPAESPSVQYQQQTRTTDTHTPTTGMNRGGGS